MQTFGVRFHKFIHKYLHRFRVQTRQFQHKTLSCKRFDHSEQIFIFASDFRTDERSDAFCRNSSAMNRQQSDSRFILCPQAHYFVLMRVFIDDCFELRLKCRPEFLNFYFVFFGLLGRGTFALADNLYLTKLCTAR